MGVAKMSSDKELFVEQFAATFVSVTFFFRKKGLL